MKYQFISKGKSEMYSNLSDIPYIISGYTKDGTVRRNQGWEEILAFS